MKFGSTEHTRALARMERAAKPHGLAALSHWMRAHLQSSDGIDLYNGIDVNMTELAERCAHEHDHDEWLDDDQHDVWTAASEVAAWYEQLQTGDDDAEHSD